MGRFIQTHSLRELYEAKGKVEFTETILHGIKSGDLKLDRYSIRELAEACKFPGSPDEFNGLRMRPDLAEAVDWTTFPTLNQQIIQAWMIPVFDAMPHYANLLCTEQTTHDDVNRIGGFTEGGPLRLRPVGGDYDEYRIDEKSIQVLMDAPSQNAGPYGRAITLKAEDIWFDRTGQLKSRAEHLGTRLAELDEKEFFYRFQDLTNWYCWYPSGTRTAIYSAATAADTTGLTARYSLYNTNVLTDYTDINNVNLYRSRHTNEVGEIIDVGPATHLVIPVCLSATAAKIRVELGGAPNKGIAVAYTAAVVAMLGAPTSFEIVVSPYLSEESTASNSAWYWGSPKKQFVRLVGPPMGVTAVALTPQSSLYMKNNTVFHAKADWWKRTIATDYRYVVKSTHN